MLLQAFFESHVVQSDQDFQYLGQILLRLWGDLHFYQENKDIFWVPSYKSSQQLGEIILALIIMMAFGEQCNYCHFCNVREWEKMQPKRSKCSKTNIPPHPHHTLFWDQSFKRSSFHLIALLFFFLLNMNIDFFPPLL